METINQVLAEMAVQYWKLCEAFEREAVAGEATAAQLRYARNRLDMLLERAGLRLQVYDGQAWDPSLPPSPLNVDNVGADPITVERTIEPTILAGGQVLLSGKVLLKEA